MITVAQSASPQAPQVAALHAKGHHNEANELEKSTFNAQMTAAQMYLAGAYMPWQSFVASRCFGWQDLSQIISQYWSLWRLGSGSKKFRQGSVLV